MLIAARAWLFALKLFRAGEMISRSHFRKSLTARKFIFMRRMLETFALMMILQMKPDRSHPHEIIFKSTLSRVAFEEQPVGLQFAFKLKASAVLQVEGLGHAAVEGYATAMHFCVDCSPDERDLTGKMFRQKFFHNLSPAVSVFGRKFVSCARRCQKTHNSSRFGEILPTAQKPPKKSLLNRC